MGDYRIWSQLGRMPITKEGGDGLTMNLKLHDLVQGYGAF